MNGEITPGELAYLYPFPAIRGQRITRLEEANLGQFALDAHTAHTLGKENVGVLVCDCGNLEWMTNRVWQLADDTVRPTWVVVAATGASLDELIRLTCERFELLRPRRSPRHWRYRSLLFTTPEGLADANGVIAAEPTVSAIILVDPACMVHQARRGHGGWRGPDRPQRFSDYRATVRSRGWSTPFFVWTQKPAKSLPSLSMESAYGVSGWWFLDGRHLRTGHPPSHPFLANRSTMLCL